VERSIVVDVPVSTVYNQWTQFEDFPRFMGGISQVEQLDPTTLRWVAEIAGVRRQWNAAILEQVPDQKIAWAATEGATNAGAVTFEPAGAAQTRVTLALEYEPEGVVEQVGDRLNLVERQVQSDLEKFKEFIEDAGYASGAWRGEVTDLGPVGTPGVEDATSQGDSGTAGISKKVMAAGAAAAAAGIAAAAAVKGRSGQGEETETTGEATEIVDVPPASPVGMAGESTVVPTDATYVAEPGTVPIDVDVDAPRSVDRIDDDLAR
jgi:carbon monoxide dehydrogenase subunit G